MGLSALDCPRCGRWDEDGEYPTYHGSRAIEIVEKGKKREYHDICDKCFKELEKKGGRVYYMAQRLRYVKVYGKDPHIEYGSVKKTQCKICYNYFEGENCPFKLLHEKRKEK
jgi:hypothetical protein